MTNKEKVTLSQKIIEYVDEKISDNKAALRYSMAKMQNDPINGLEYEFCHIIFSKKTIQYLTSFVTAAAELQKNFPVDEITRWKAARKILENHLWSEVHSNVNPSSTSQSKNLVNNFVREWALDEMLGNGSGYAFVERINEMIEYAESHQK